MEQKQQVVRKRRKTEKVSSKGLIVTLELRNRHESSIFFFHLTLNKKVNTVDVFPEMSNNPFYTTSH